MQGGLPFFGRGKSAQPNVSSASDNIEHYDDDQSWFVGWISNWGSVVLDGIVALGDFSIFAYQTFVWMLTRIPKKETLWPNFYQVGVSSLPVVALTGTFIGMVLAVQSYFQFRQIGLETRLGGVINMTLVRELGPCPCRHYVGRTSRKFDGR